VALNLRRYEFSRGRSRAAAQLVDEFGYSTYGDDAANALFHVVNERGERG